MGHAVFLAVIFVSAALLYRQTYNFEQNFLAASSGPDIVPRCILICIMLLAAAIFVRDFRKRKHFVFMELFRGSTGIVTLMLPGYLVGVAFLGFCVPSFLMLSILFTFLSPAPLTPCRMARYGLVSLILTGGTFTLFGNVFHIMLPTGPWGY